MPQLPRPFVTNLHVGPTFRPNRAPAQSRGTAHSLQIQSRPSDCSLADIWHVDKAHQRERDPGRREPPEDARSSPRYGPETRAISPARGGGHSWGGSRAVGRLKRTGSSASGVAGTLGNTQPRTAANRSIFLGDFTRFAKRDGGGFVATCHIGPELRLNSAACRSSQVNGAWARRQSSTLQHSAFQSKSLMYMCPPQGHPRADCSLRKPTRCCSRPMSINVWLPAETGKNPAQMSTLDSSRIPTPRGLAGTRRPHVGETTNHIPSGDSARVTNTKLANISMYTKKQSCITTVRGEMR